MRKYKRYMAHKNMEKKGLKHVNRDTDPATGKRKDSYFARNWKDWVNVG